MRATLNPTRGVIVAAATVAAFACTSGAASYNWPPAETLMQTGEPDGIGPFAGLNIHDKPVGWAYATGRAGPDLFVNAGRWGNQRHGVYLYRYVGRRDGTPIFENPRRLGMPQGIPPRTPCVVVETERGRVDAVWKLKRGYVHGRLDDSRTAFVPVQSGDADRLWRSADGDWATTARFPGGEAITIRGTRFGVLQCREGDEVVGHVVDADGVIVRNETTGAHALAYPSTRGLPEDLIVFGEGGYYYHRSAGRVDGRGQPVYRPKTPLLQRGAPLWHSSLPVIDAADWDNDGDLDLISGDSAGFVALLENAGSNSAPRFLAPVRLEACDRAIRVRTGYYLSRQGAKEANWGYTSPTVIDWNADGRLDIVMSSATSEHRVVLNTGVGNKPRLAAPVEIYGPGGLDLHGDWRVKPAAGVLQGRVAYVLVDDDQHLHLYWRLDAQNVEDGGKLLLEDGLPIAVSGRGGGQGGRVKMTLVDWDRDDRPDLLLACHRSRRIPHPGGLPGGRGAMVLLMRNVSAGGRLRFASPRPVRYRGKELRMGEHSCSAAPWPFGNRYGLILAIENGRFYQVRPEDLSWGRPAPPRGATAIRPGR